MGSMERTISVDDLVGGLWRGLGQVSSTTFNRTDSEAAFQEFLKKIPSTTNLAALAGGDSQAQATAQQAFVQQLQQQNAASGALPTAALTDVNGAPGVMGMPRVPSLDFLRQLMVNQQQFAPNNGNAPVKIEGPAASSAFRMPEPAEVIKPAAAPVALPTMAYPQISASAPMSMGLHHLSPTELAHISAAQNLLQAGFPGGGNPLAAAAALNPAAAAAAALQLGQLGQLSRLTTGIPDKDSVEKAEVRRARRMLSNRESARRSRRRKQEHLSKLEVEINGVETEKKSLEDRVTSAERRCISIEDENKRLREENDRLRDELRFLRTEITERKERNGYYNRREADSDDEQPTKRQHKGDKDHKDHKEHKEKESPRQNGEKHSSKHDS